MLEMTANEKPTVTLKKKKSVRSACVVFCVEAFQEEPRGEDGGQGAAAGYGRESGVRVSVSLLCGEHERGGAGGEHEADVLPVLLPGACVAV